MNKKISPYDMTLWPSKKAQENLTLRCGLTPLLHIETCRRTEKKDANVKALVQLGQIDHWIRRASGYANTEIALSDANATVHAMLSIDRNGKPKKSPLRAEMPFGTDRFEAATGQIVIADLFVPAGHGQAPVVFSFREEADDQETAVKVKLQLREFDWSSKEGQEALAVLRTHHERMKKHLKANRSPEGSRIYIQMEFEESRSWIMQMPHKGRDTREFRDGIREIYPGCEITGYGPE